jgi:RNA polymerase sigma factor (sigma-70 family)
MKDRTLTKEGLEHLLDWLGADREAAARKYESIRRDLINYFDNRVGAEAEDLTDKTINRVITKAPQITGSYTGDPKYYFFRVAHLVRLEHIRTLARKDSRPLPNDLPDLQSSAAAEKEVMNSCLHECLQKLPTEDRDIFLLYYREGDRAQIEYRRELAGRRSISINALRLLVYRLKEKLRACITDCRSRDGDA